MLMFVHSGNYHSENEIEIVFDEEGAQLLVETVQNCLQSRDHEHLIVNELGRNSLTIEPGTDAAIKLATFRFAASG